MQRQWVGHLYHVTDVNNAAAILASGSLLSHHALVDGDIPFVHSASMQVMAGTNAWVHRFVRLYFRPKTPTFYINEGLRPADDILDDAHCPVPVALVFDAARVMSMSGVRWSEHTLAAHVAKPWMGDDADSLEAMDFAAIYHCTPFGADMDERQRRRLKGARQAEVVVPDRLYIDPLLRVVTRSEADRKTLRTLIWDREVRGLRLQRLQEIICVNPGVFHDEWTTIADVQHWDGWVRIVSRAPIRGTAEFAAEIAWTGQDRVERPDVVRFTYNPATTVRVPVPPDLADRLFRMTLRLDGNLAFTGWFRPEGEFLIPPTP